MSAVIPEAAAAALAPGAAWTALRDRAVARYRPAGRFSTHFARGKLQRDPVFRALVERGLVGAQHERILDIGCGQGLLAALLHAMAQMQREEGHWPAAWPAAPAAPHYTGIELMPRDVERAWLACAGLLPSPDFVCADMCRVELPPSDLVVILDVLHYVDYPAQEGVLTRVRDALAPGGGRLLLRVGDMASRGGFAVSQWVDRTVTRVRGHSVSPTWGRPLADWDALLQRLGFAVQQLPMSQGTPFANVLLLADLEPAP